MPNSRNPTRLLLPALAVSLTACATSLPPLPPPQTPPPQIPPPPAELLQEPDLSKSYSDIVRQLLLDWQRRLTDWRRSS